MRKVKEKITRQHMIFRDIPGKYFDISDIFSYNIQKLNKKYLGCCKRLRKTMVLTHNT